ncbi:ribonuclease HII family protein [Tritrichomonas foetus]|uniref:Ribonuclease n=1 Tax=Tritrichomonas foetus TaxID=1144522 RepID=A0A1J4JGA5_9EUKA|nr:ribonuclease HII family protein [Tritrichomonas foetus]|eukprot:OHS96485.1 ribonuclease HII family protein [Tritrichomonas foetus]
MMNYGGAKIEFPDELKGKKLEMGIDEAGRGPALGPMVYSCAFAEVGYKWPKYVDDSKKLTPEKRESILDKLKELPIGFSVRIISAVEISAKMLSNTVNLNEMSHEAARELVQSALDAGLNIQKLYVDTVGSPAKYQEKLEGYFPKINIKVAKKADATYKAVGAASINAKVIRDKILSNFVFEEKEIEFSRNFGSGYTSDAKTVNWLKSTFDPVFGFPSVTRFSWDTIKKLTTKNEADADFETEKKPPIDSSFFARRFIRSVNLE